jgi:hypothetical protein
MTLTEDWTKGYAIELSEHHTISELVDFILAQNRADLPHIQKLANVSRVFGLRSGDAERAIERVAGGILLAAFGDQNHAPDSERDPIAHASYRMTIDRRQHMMAN